MLRMMPPGWASGSLQKRTAASKRRALCTLHFVELQLRGCLTGAPSKAPHSLAPACSVSVCRKLCALPLAPLRCMCTVLYCAVLCRRPVSLLGFRRKVNFLIPVWSRVSPLRTREVAVLLPPNVACRCAQYCHQTAAGLTVSPPASA